MIILSTFMKFMYMLNVVYLGIYLEILNQLKTMCYSQTIILAFTSKDHKEQKNTKVCRKLGLMTQWIVSMKSWIRGLAWIEQRSV